MPILHQFLSPCYDHLSASKNLITVLLVSHLLRLRHATNLPFIIPVLILHPSAFTSTLTLLPKYSKNASQLCALWFRFEF
jgi:hypothetical protein